jgi:iron-sulfur cluster assembly protein
LTLRYDWVYGILSLPTEDPTRRGAESMGVTLTEKAASEVKKVIEKMVEEQGLPEGGELVLRVGVQGGGCSGFSYSLGFDTTTSERDRVVEVYGVRLAVDKKFDPYLDGTVVDYYDGLEKRGFVFNNPNVVKSCGCGSSFQV